MSDKRKGFRNFSLVLFYIFSLLAVIACALISIQVARNREKVHTRPLNYDSLARLAKQEIDSFAKRTGIHLASEKRITIVGDVYHPTEIRDSLFALHIYYDSTKNGIGEWQHHVKSVNVSYLADPTKKQTLLMPEVFPFESYHIPVVMEDMNFDGYSDFRVLDFVMMYGQSSYHYWLYNPVKDAFEPDTVLEKTSSPHFDPQTKTVFSSCRGAGPFDEVNETFTWGEGKLVLQEREEFITKHDYQNTYIIAMTKRINGKLVERTGEFAEPPITSTGQPIYDWEKLK